MHIHTLEKWQHPHQFEQIKVAQERKVWAVIGLTLLTMIVEIVAGIRFGSMALLADGWHMGTHAAALGITAAAYYLARKHAADRRFSFGTGKIGVLGGFTSAVVLSLVALLMIVESIQRLLSPHPILFNEAIAVATVGLVVNLLSALLLQKKHDHDHGDADLLHHGHDHHDHNLRGAYLHVLADALTSVLAILALLAGKTWHWIWLDPLIGVVGSIVIALWAGGLLRETAKILLDRDADPLIVERIYQLIESDLDNRICDLHVWKIGSNQLAVILSVVTHYPQPVDHYKALLMQIHDVTHVTVEVNHCQTPPCIAACKPSAVRS
jgi:cation diffusion facilitator family transporter